MRKLKAWLKRQAARNSQFLSITDLLFAKKRVRYLYFRLRYFTLLIAVRLFFHLTIFYLLHQAITPVDFYQLGGIWVISLLLSSVWWGGLEVLRTRIRDFYSTKAIESMRQEISHWFLMGLAISSVAFITAISLLIIGIIQWQQTQAAFSYFFNSSVVFMLAGRLIVEPLHSGIYAISRILRPLSSLLMGEGLGFLCLIIGWPWLGKTSIPLAFFVAGVINLAMRYYYCKQMYSFYEITLTFVEIKLAKFLRQLPWRDFLLGGLAMLAINIESLLLFMVVGLNSKQVYFHHLLILLFLIFPLFNATSEWAQLFYFDWKKLRRVNFTSLQQHYDYNILLLAPVMGSCLGLVAILCGYIFLPPIPVIIYGSLFVVLVVRSLIAYLQVRAFACFHYLDILMSSLLLLTLLGLVSWLQTTLVNGIVLVSVGLTAMVGYLWKPRFPAVDRVSQFKQQINYYDWLSQLRAAIGQLQVGTVTVAASTSYYKQLHIVSWLIANCLQPTDRICVIGKHIVFYRLNATHYRPINKANLAMNSAGLISACQLTPVFQKQTSILPAELMRYLVKSSQFKSPNKPANINCADFLQQFPDGIYFAPACHLGPLARVPDKHIIHSLLYYTELFLTAQTDAQFPYEIAASYRAGTIQAIYAVPKANYSRKQLQAWRLTIDSSNIYTILQERVTV